MPRHHYVAEVAFDQLHDDAERRGWLADLRGFLLTECDAEVAFDDSDLIAPPGSDGLLSVTFDSEQTPSLRRSRMRRLADAIESRRRDPAALPDVWPTKWTMA